MQALSLDEIFDQSETRFTYLDQWDIASSTPSASLVANKCKMNLVALPKVLRWAGVEMGKPSGLDEWKMTYDHWKTTTLCQFLHY